MSSAVPPPPLSPPGLAARALFGLPNLGTNGTLFPGKHTALSTENNALYFGIIAVVGVTILVLVCLCCFSCCGGEPAGLHSHELEGRPTTTGGTNTLSRRGSIFEGHASLPRSLAATRVRVDSLPENRKSNETAAAAAAGPYIAANGGRKDFPVVRVHVKRQPDEMNLVVNDRVVLAAVYPDGWAAGVSKRSGGPWLFPLVCLGGSVPRVLLQRSQAQQANAAAGGGGGGGRGGPSASAIARAPPPPPSSSSLAGGPGRFEPVMGSSSVPPVSPSTLAPMVPPPMSFASPPPPQQQQVRTNNSNNSRDALAPMSSRYASGQNNPNHRQQQQHPNQAAHMLRSMQPPPPSAQRAYRPQQDSNSAAGGGGRGPTKSMYSDISGV
ncbi:hypothetical protein HDU86_005763 [Geranomyces michiganensis]|nr:hypothetical protein HDU86_005763 [Geranomyces michiganensis]